MASQNFIYYELAVTYGFAHLNVIEHSVGKIEISWAVGYEEKEFGVMPNYVVNFNLYVHNNYKQLSYKL